MNFFKIIMTLLICSCVHNKNDDQQETAALKNGRYVLVYSSQTFTGLTPGNNFLEIFTGDSGFFQTERERKNEPCYLIQLRFNYAISNDTLKLTNVEFHERLHCDSSITFSDTGNDREFPILINRNDTLSIIYGDTLVYYKEKEI